MVRIITWNGRKVRMDVCTRCGIGAGITIYPDGPFIHQQTALRDGLCDDCVNSARKIAAAPTGRETVLV